MREHGQQAALASLGLVKSADARSWLIARLIKGRGLAKPQSTSTFAKLFGEPGRLLHPIELIKDVASLKPTREAWQKMRDPTLSAWQRAKATGSLTGDVVNKTFFLGMPALGIHRAMTTTPEPGSTKGEAIGQAVGESLGWLPPLGAVGLATSIFAPQYSLPHWAGRAGKAIGGGISKATGEQPTPYPEEALPPPEFQYRGNSQ